jgi:membrane protein YdbS with pleckstrin-like domain
MPFPTRLLIEGEELILDLRPHWIALVRAVGVAILTIVAWIVLLPRLPDGSSHDVLFWLVIGLGILAMLWWTVRDSVHWATSHFVVTSDRVIHRQGLIAKNSMEIPLEAINDVRFHQGVFERMIGAGDLIIQSASESGREVFGDIRHPEDVQKTIYHQGEQNQKRMYQGMGSGAAVASSSNPAGTPSMAAELQRLAELRDKGVLTESEFQNQKKKILGEA